MKGKSAYGCSRFKEDCKYLLPFHFETKKLTEKQLADLFTKKQTAVIKGFTFSNSFEKKDGKIVFDKDYKLTFLPI